MRRMRWTRMRVNRMRLTEWRRELIPQERWCISKSIPRPTCVKERLVILTRKIQMVELGWQQMRSGFYIDPRRRRFEAFTTDAKIIRLISRCVAIFPAAAARQIFDGDCDAASRGKISVVIPPNFRPCGFLDKSSPVDKILHRPMRLHWLSLRCFWRNLVTSVDLLLPAFIIFLHQEKWD